MVDNLTSTESQTELQDLESEAYLAVVSKTDAEWLTTLLSLMGYESCVSDRLEEVSNEQKSHSQNHWLEISSEGLQESQIQNLIGKDGSVLDAIQHLANVSLNRYRELASAETPNNASEDQQDQSQNQAQSPHFYTVELAGYRSQYLANLQTLADNAVQQVRETQTEFVIEKLSASDRRYIHQLLENHSDIQTYSQGKEPNRHLVVKLTGV